MCKTLHMCWKTCLINWKKQNEKNFRMEISLDLGYKGKEHLFFHYRASEPPTCEWEIPHSLSPIWEVYTLSHHESQKSWISPSSKSWRAGCWHNPLCQSDTLARDAKEQIEWNIGSTGSHGGGIKRWQQQWGPGSCDTLPAVWLWLQLWLLRFHPFLLTPWP